MGHGQQGGSGEADDGTSHGALLNSLADLLGDAGLVLVGSVVQLVERRAADVEQHPAHHGQEQRGNDCKAVVAGRQLCNLLRGVSLLRGQQQSCSQTHARRRGSRPAQQRHSPILKF